MRWYMTRLAMPEPMVQPQKAVRNPVVPNWGEGYFDSVKDAPTATVFQRTLEYAIDTKADAMRNPEGANNVSNINAAKEALATLRKWCLYAYNKERLFYQNFAPTGLPIKGRKDVNAIQQVMRSWFEASGKTPSGLKLPDPSKWPTFPKYAMDPADAGITLKAIVAELDKKFGPDSLTSPVSTAPQAQPVPQTNKLPGAGVGGVGGGAVLPPSGTRPLAAR